MPTATLQSKLPEAAASITFSLKTPGGYPALFTMRGTNEDELLERATGVEVFLKDSGYTPDVKTYGRAKTPAPKVVVAGETCPKCGGKVLEKSTKTGKAFQECENRKYDFETKQTTGCEYIKWMDDDSEPLPFGDDGATPKQILILKEKNLWEEGMTKAKASEVIGKVLGK